MLTKEERRVAGLICAVDAIAVLLDDESCIVAALRVAAELVAGVLINE